MMRLYAKRLLPALVVIAGACTYRDIPQPSQIFFDCSQSTLAAAEGAKVNASNCDAINGNFTVHATGGTGPYLFSFNGGNYQSDSTLSGLGAGVYLVTVKDANLCQKSISVEITASGSTLNGTATTVDDSQCLTNNGSVTVTASGGTAPYTYQFGSAAAGSNNVFSGLKAGYYLIVVKDANACLHVVNAWVHRGETGTSFATDIKPILDANCSISGCHNGDNGATINWTVFANVKSHAANIKTRTQNKTMPLSGSLAQDQIDLIACWVDDGAIEN